jgi:hypothetical protein
MPGAYLSTNLISSGSAITPSTEDEAYPATNLYDRQSARVFRGESPTSLTILIDFGAAVLADTLAIINHNLTAAATLSLKAGTSSPPSTAIATPTYRANDIWKAFTGTTARYWLLAISDSNPSPIEIGQLVLGVRVEFPRGRRIGEGYKPAVKRFTIVGETYAGVFWNYHVFQRREFNPSFRVANASEESVLRALDTSTCGNLWPFVYIPDVSGTDCYYVRKEQDYEPQEYGERTAGPEKVHEYTMALAEESRGLQIQA